MLIRVAIVLFALVIALAAGGPLLVMAVAPDHDAPSELARILPEAKRSLAGQLDEHTSVVRYVGWEHRERDHLIILMFELRRFPYVTMDRAYLGSRCTPIDALDPVGMSGGRGVDDFATDPEIEYLRSGDQPACEEGS